MIKLLLGILSFLTLNCSYGQDIPSTVPTMTVFPDQIKVLVLNNNEHLVASTVKISEVDPNLKLNNVVVKYMFRYAVFDCNKKQFLPLIYYAYDKDKNLIQDQILDKHKWEPVVDRFDVNELKYDCKEKEVQI